MRCKYCFRKENNGAVLNLALRKQIIEKLATSGFFSKITFVGGEPLLDKENLLKMLKYAKSLGMKTMVVTNGSLITDEFLD